MAIAPVLERVLRLMGLFGDEWRLDRNCYDTVSYRHRHRPIRLFFRHKTNQLKMDLRVDRRPHCAASFTLNPVTREYVLTSRDAFRLLLAYLQGATDKELDRNTRPGNDLTPTHHASPARPGSCGGG